MKIDELGKIVTGIAKLHGDESNQVVIEGLEYSQGKTLHVSTSSESINIIASIIIDPTSKVDLEDED